MLCYYSLVVLLQPVNKGAPVCLPIPNTFVMVVCRITIVSHQYGYKIFVIQMKGGT